MDSPLDCNELQASITVDNYLKSKGPFISQEGLLYIKLIICQLDHYCWYSCRQHIFEMFGEFTANTFYAENIVEKYQILKRCGCYTYCLV